MSTPYTGERLSRSIAILLEAATDAAQSKTSVHAPDKPVTMNAILINSTRNRMKERKPGRPRAIPERLISEVLSLYQQGLGYRALARELRQMGVSVDWSTVRMVVKSHLGQRPE